MKKNRKNLLFLQGSLSLGNGIIGIFFPFLLMEAFSLSLLQVLWWDALFLFLITILVYPVNFLFSQCFSHKQILTFGLLFQALFLICLSIGQKIPGIFVFATLFHLLFICLFWPHFNYKTQRSTDDTNRGDFAGNFQAMVIGTGIVAPVISGYLLEYNLEEYVIIVATIFFFVSMFFSNKINIQEQKISSYKKFLGFFNSLSKQPYFPGILADGVQSGIMWMIWPIYLKVVVGKFFVMGLLNSVRSVVEIFASKIIGKMTDRFSYTKMKNIGIFSRMIDLWYRVIFWFFPSVWVVGSGMIMSAILGPLFQIPIHKRTSQIADLHAHKIDFWIWREVFLNAVRTIFLIGTAGLFCLFGEGGLWIAFLLGGISILGFRKY